MDKLKKELGLKIRRLRQLKGFTQEKLGEKSGISYKFVGMIERGEVNPSLDSLASIAAALRIDIKDLFPGEGDQLLQLSREDLSVIEKATTLLYNRLNLKSKSSKKHK